MITRVPTLFPAVRLEMHFSVCARCSKLTRDAWL